MTEFYHPEQQQTKLTESSSLLTRSEMPSFYSSTRDGTIITKHLTDHHDDDDPDSIDKEAFILQIFQHWKIKTLEHQHAINQSKNNTTSNHFSQAFTNTVSSVNTSNNETISHEISSNMIEPEKSMTTMRKRVTPLPKLHVRQKDTLKKSITSPTDFSNPNLLAPHTRIRSRTIATATPTKKATKPAPIFIAPKKTQPSPLPRSYSLFSMDESAQIKRKPMLDKQNSVNDDQSLTSTSPTWAPTRFFAQSLSSSLDDDGTSSDDSCHESLLIRDKKRLKKRTKNTENYPLSIHPNLIIPTAILITDPNGNSRSYDLNNEFFEEFANIERIIDNDIIPSIMNSEISQPASSNSLDKYLLHSIGEEDEGSIEKNNNNGIILSKELNRIEAFTRSRQTNLTVQNNNSNLNKNDKIQLGRRWSDGVVSDDDQDIGSPQSAPLVKMASTTSVMKQPIAPPANLTSTMSVIKQPINPPAKISKTKSFLMKLHLISSSNKDDDSNIPTITPTNPPPSRKRTVHRSTDKKRYQTQ
jgi:hypothetical protein